MKNEMPQHRSALKSDCDITDTDMKSSDKGVKCPDGRGKSGEIRGIITKGVGGLYTVRPDIGSDKVLLCRARGVFRHEHITPTVGDTVIIRREDVYPDGDTGGEDNSYNDVNSDDTERGGITNAGKRLNRLIGGRGIGRGTPSSVKRDIRCDGIITDILPRKNLLIRPPLANADVIFVIIPVCRPQPDLSSADKLLCITEHADITPTVIITKAELDAAEAGRIENIYRAAGFEVFVVSSAADEGISELTDYIRSLGVGAVTAFAGVSGAGKSTLLNKIFPSLSLVTGTLSHKIERGKQTTRHVELYAAAINPLYGGGNVSAYVADTPGFSLLDFERFDFFSCEALPYTFREFEPYIGHCRYTKCTHIQEDGCAVIAAVTDGIIPPERHKSYRELYAILKNKHPWDNK